MLAKKMKNAVAFQKICILMCAVLSFMNHYSSFRLADNIHFNQKRLWIDEKAIDEHNLLMFETV